MYVVVSYSYADDKRIVVRVVTMSHIFFRELNYRAFSPCYLWYGARQLNILDHPKVRFVGFFGQPSGRCSSYDHPYVPYGVLDVHYPIGGAALEGVDLLSPS